MNSPFTKPVNNKNVLELFMALSIEEKNILDSYGAQHLLAGIDYDSFYPETLCQYLWVSAANIIPQGYYDLATTLLFKALEYAETKEDLGHIHANLAQVFADLKENRQCVLHCQKTLETGYFTEWVTNLLSETQ